MADQRITQLTKLAQADVAANDVLAIVDVGSSITKKVEAKELFQAGANLADSASIDLIKLNQSSTTKLGTTALADDAVTAAKLADDSSIVYDSVAPSTNNFEGRGYVNSTSKNLQVWNGSSFDQVVAPTAGIENLAVTTGKLAANAVTTAKVDAAGLAAAALATDSVITAKIQDLAVTTGKLAALSVTTAKIAADAVTADELASNAVVTASIVDANVTEAKLATGAVTEAKIGTAAVTVAKVADGSLTYAKLNLADGSVPGAKLTGASVTTTQIAANAINTSQIVDDAVTAAKIADDAITADQLATNSVTADAIAANAVGASELADDAVDTAAIVNVAVTEAKLATGAVTEAKLGTAAVTVTKIADTSITYAKLNLADGSVPGGKLTDATVTSAKLASNAITTGSITDLNVTTAKLADGAVTAAKITDATITTAKIAAGGLAESAIATDAITTGKILDDAVTAAKLANDSSTVVQAGTPSGSGAFEGQLWFDTNTSVKYVWNGAAWIRQAAINAITFSDTTPLNFSVAYPDNHSAVITTTLDTQVANRALLGPLTGADAAPTFRDIEPGDLPDATGSTKGIIQPGTGLAVNAGVLNHSNSATAGTFTKVTIDTQGHVTVGALLDAADVPVLDAAKITTGELPTARVADNAITSGKLADYSTASIGEGLPVADFIGQIHLNPLDRAFFMWDGNVYVPIGISAGQIIFAGTFDASDPANRGKVASVTPEGAAAGFTVGSALPASSLANNRHYLVVSEGGTINTGNAPHVTLAPPDLILSVYSTTSPAWVEIDVSSGAGAIAASQVSFTAIGDIAATNVQTAIEEVSTECRNATNITSGTLAVARGGTNVASYTKGDLLAASASTTLTKLPVGTNGQVLRANSATATGLEYGADFVGTVTTVTSSTAALTVATATTTPALTVRAATTSVDGIVQLSDSTSTTSSVLAATPTAVKSAYDLAALALPAAGGTVTGELLIGSAGTLVFEGSTNDGNETTLAVADPTADRTITLPNQTGTVLVSGNASIVNADVNASAAIAGTKVSPDFGSQTVVTTGVFSHALGAAATPSITFTGDLNTGIYSPGADQVAVATNGTGRLFVDATGNVGIGASPSGSKLEVNGGSIGVVNAAGTDIKLSFDVTGVVGGAIGFNDSGTTNAYGITDNTAYVGIAQSFPLAFSTAGQERLRITSAGNVGIGTTSPSSPLQVVGEISSGAAGTNGSISLRRTSDGASINSIAYDSATEEMRLNNGSGNGRIVFQTVSTERARVDSSGRLLVGTSTARSTFYSTASAFIQIEGGAASGSESLAIVRNVNDIFGGSLILAKTRGTGDTIVTSGDTIGNVTWQGNDGSKFVQAARIEAQVDGTPGTNDMPGRLVFFTTADGQSTPTERMRIKSTGTINFSSVATYADNTAALAGGLVAGDVYRKSDGTLMITY